VNKELERRAGRRSRGKNRGVTGKGGKMNRVLPGKSGRSRG
jgi:hypothetical protein